MTSPAACSSARYQGMQTVYDVEMGGQKLEALNSAPPRVTAPIGEIALTLPPEACGLSRRRRGGQMA